MNFKISVLWAVERLNSIHPPSYLSPAVVVPPAIVMSVSSAPNPAFSVYAILVSRFEIEGAPKLLLKDEGMIDAWWISPVLTSKSQSPFKNLGAETSSEAAISKFEIEEKRLINSRPLCPWPTLHP